MTGEPQSTEVCPLRGPVGLNAWHVGVHINLNEGKK